MNEPISSNLEKLTAEILIYKQQTAMNIIEVGKRLIQVKKILPHGEWGKWLEEKAEFSQRTANNFMKVANEFSNSQTFANLPPSKVFALLDVPQEERETFIQENKVDGMSVRQLKEAIKAKKEAEQKTKEAEENVNDLVSEVQRLNKELSKKTTPEVIEKVIEIEKIPEKVKEELQKANLVQKQNEQLTAENKNLKGQLNAVLSSPEQERIAYESKAGTFTRRITSFLHDMAALTYIGQEVISATPYTRKEYEKALNQLERWTREMRISLSSVDEKEEIIDVEVI